MTLNGTLEDFSPAGILKVLSADGRTGAVRFGGPAGCTVYLHRGQLYFARDSHTDEALATALVRPGRLSADAWGQAIDEAEDQPVVGQLLVKSGAIAPDLLASVVLSVVYDPLIALFRDGTGEFDFEPDTVHWLGPFRAFPVDAIVGEVRKRAREVDEWSANIPSLDVYVEACRTLPDGAGQVTLLREDWELVTALTGHRTISELAADLGRGSYSTARVVHRLLDARLVEVITSNKGADVVPLRRQSTPAVEVEAERDPMLDLGLPHRTPAATNTEGTDPLTAHIGDAIADALAQADHEPVATEPGAPTLSITPAIEEVDHQEPWDQGRSRADLTEADTDTADTDTADVDDDLVGHAGVEHSPDLDDLFMAPDDELGTDEDAALLEESTWDHSRRVADGNALHHDGSTLTSLDEPRPRDPNAAWLADLYAQFIDDPESNSPKKRRRGEPNPVDVAFKASEQEGEEKVSTLKRLLGALKKL
jgi:hypothetical protein